MVTDLETDMLRQQTKAFYSEKFSEKELKFNAGCREEESVFHCCSSLRNTVKTILL